MKDQLTPEDLGYQVVEIPVRQVRVVNHGRWWCVEYRKKNGSFIDRYWWWDDSKHSNFVDASVRAYTMNALGKIETFRKMGTVVMTVKEEQNKKEIGFFKKLINRFRKDE